MIRGDVGLEIGERQDKIGLQGENLINFGRREGAHARLLAASLWRAHDIAGDPDDAILLAEQINRFDGLPRLSTWDSRRIAARIVVVDQVFVAGSNPNVGTIEA